MCIDIYKGTVTKKGIIEIFGEGDTTWHQFFDNPDDKNLIFNGNFEALLEKTIIDETKKNKLLELWGQLYYRWFDPDSLYKGVLLSDRIRFYVDKLKLIDPFHLDNLDPASYSLTVGDEFYIDNERRTPKKGKIEIPRNGLVYIKIHENLNIPYYMIAQHDLRVKQVYRGFLAGRSLQISPGYFGHINYPIYNFTDDYKVLKVGDKITSISFIKTTQFGNNDFLEKGRCLTEKELKENTVEGIEGKYECKKLDIDKDRSIPEYWLEFGGENHSSSVLKVRDDFKKLERYIRWARRIGYIAVLALIVALFKIIQDQNHFITGVVKDSSNAFAITQRLDKEMKDLKGDISTTVNELKNEINKLKEKDLKTPPK